MFLNNFHSASEVLGIFGPFRTAVNAGYRVTSVYTMKDKRLKMEK